MFVKLAQTLSAWVQGLFLVIIVVGLSKKEVNELLAAMYFGFAVHIAKMGSKRAFGDYQLFAQGGVVFAFHY